MVTGGTRSADFPVTAGAYDQTHNGQDDAFVARLTAAGDALDWSTFLGGSESDRGLVLVLDADARPTVMGYTLSADLPVTPGAFDATANGSYDVFVHRFTADGGRLLAGTYLGGEGRDETYSAVPDPAGNLLLIGMTHSPDFPVTPGAYDTSYGGDADAFVARIDPRTWNPWGWDRRRCRRWRRGPGPIPSIRGSSSPGRCRDPAPWRCGCSTRGESWCAVVGRRYAGRSRRGGLGRA